MSCTPSLEDVKRKLDHWRVGVCGPVGDLPIGTERNRSKARTSLKPMELPKPGTDDGSAKTRDNSQFGYRTETRPSPNHSAISKVFTPVVGPMINSRLTQ